MPAKDIARGIVREWWKHQDQLIPTSRLQNALIDAVAFAIDMARQQALDEAAQVDVDRAHELSEQRVRWAKLHPNDDSSLLAYDMEIELLKNQAQAIRALKDK